MKDKVKNIQLIKMKTRSIQITRFNEVIVNRDENI